MSKLKTKQPSHVNKTVCKIKKKKVFFFNKLRTSGDSLVVIVVWKSIDFGSDTNRTGAEGLSFYYPKLLYCPDQMLAVMVLSQHRVLSSKTVRPRAPCGARCIEHAVSTWSAVCSEAPHSLLVKERDPFVHGRMESPNTSPQAIELNPSCLGQAYSNRPAIGPGYKNTELGCTLTVLRVSVGNSYTEKRGCIVQQGYFIDFAQLAQTGV